MRVVGLGAVAVVVGACALPTETGDELGERRDAWTSTIEVRGTLTYDDQRQVGRFDMHLDANGSPGTASTGGTNLLGAMDVEVQVYEIDTATGPGCQPSKLVGTGTTDEAGTFVIDVPATDSCRERNIKPDLRVVFTLRHDEPSRSWSVGDTAAYAMDHPSATASQPYQSDQDVTLPPAVFGGSDDHFNAALVHAGAAEVTRVIHLEHQLPFDGSLGPVHWFYPRNVAGVQTGVAGNILIPEPSQAIHGGALFHEYGHSIHLRAVDSNNLGAKCGVDYSANDPGLPPWAELSWAGWTYEYPDTALAEGWAQFIKFVTLEDVGAGCTAPSRDLGEVYSYDLHNAPYTPSVAVDEPNLGQGYVGNVARFLCDWHDDTQDDNPLLAGPGDRKKSKVVYLYHHLVDAMGASNHKTCVDACDLSEHFVFVKKSAAVVGWNKHNNQRNRIHDTARNNGIYCPALDITAK